MTLNLLVEDVMKGNKKETCVVYSFDGSAMNGVGNYVVQSFTVNEANRSLPAFGVFSESKETVKICKLPHLTYCLQRVITITNLIKFSREYHF